MAAAVPAYNRPERHRLTSPTSRPDPYRPAPAIPTRFSYAPQADSSIGFDRHIRGVTFAGGRHGSGEGKAITLGWSRDRMDLRFSYIAEQGAIMGMPTGRGGLSLGTGARTLMIEAHRAFMLGETWALDGYASLGLTRISIGPLSLVTNASAIIGCRFGVQARGPAMGGVVSFGVAQPLKIERGAAHIMFASGYDLASRALIFDHAWASLAGERHLAVTASYRGSGMFGAFRAGTMRDFPDGGSRP